MKILVCDDNGIERAGLVESIRRYYAESETVVEQTVCSSREELLEAMKKEHQEIVLVALNGVAGMEAALSASHLQPHSLIWVSDLDFAVQSYRMGVTWFLQKPVEENLLRQALARCGETQREALRLRTSF